MRIFFLKKTRRIQKKFTKGFIQSMLHYCKHLSVILSKNLPFLPRNIYWAIFHIFVRTKPKLRKLPTHLLKIVVFRKSQRLMSKSPAVHFTSQCFQWTGFAIRDASLLWRKITLYPFSCCSGYYWNGERFKSINFLIMFSVNRFTCFNRSQ